MINLVPETYTAPRSARRRYIWRLMAMSLLILGSFVLFYGLGGGGADTPGLNLVMLVICAAFMVAGTWELVVLIRALDELQQRVQILSLAIGCGLAVMAMALLGIWATLLQTQPVNPIFIMLLAVTGYYLSLFVVGRHYRSSQ